MSLTAILDWLVGLPPALLYATLGAFAFVENLFPPIPADVVAAFGAFVASRAGRSPIPPFLIVWLSNVAGALFMYYLGRRLGRGWMERWLHLTPDNPAERRFEAMYGRFGTAAFFLSRFVPGVRAVVPPFAGALGVRPLGPALAIAAASGLWYGAISALAYRAGQSWETLAQLLGKVGWGAAAGASVMLAAMVFWWLRRRRQPRSLT
ncbi:MAG: DedA family protein [Gemmatimonadaceae bacterium]